VRAPAWCACAGAEADRAAVSSYLAALRASGALSTDDAAERWMRMTLEVAVGHTLAMRDQTTASVRAKRGGK